MYIKYDKIKTKDTLLIDVRTETEFKDNSFCDVNIPIINEFQRSIFKKCYPSAFFVIFYYGIQRRKYLKENILKVYNNTDKFIVFACSRGRLRSPLMYLYTKYILKIDCCKVLWLGIKGNIINLSYN